MSEIAAVGSRRVKGWYNLHRPLRGEATAILKRAVRLEKKREGVTSEEENETPSCAMYDFGARELYVDGRSSGSYSPNMHNKQSCYYRQASWKQFFGAQGEFAFLD